MLYLPIIVAPVREKNYVQAYGGGQGWSWSVEHGINVNGESTPEFRVHFIHYAVGYLSGTLDTKGAYRDKTIRLKGQGQFQGEPVRIDVRIELDGSGAFGKGSCYIVAYRDVNENAELDMTDIVRLSFPRGLPIQHIETSLVTSPQV